MKTVRVGVVDQFSGWAPVSLETEHFWDAGGVGVQELVSFVLAEDLRCFAHVWELEHSDRV